MIEDILKLETNEKLFVNGILGNPYEFNVLPFSGDISELSKQFCAGYSGLFIFSRCSSCNGAVTHELHSLGMSCDILAALKDLECEFDFAGVGVNCFCYYCEPSELVRNDAYYDMLFANCFSLLDNAC